MGRENGSWKAREKSVIMSWNFPITEFVVKICWSWNMSWNSRENTFISLMKMSWKKINFSRRRENSVMKMSWKCRETVVNLSWKTTGTKREKVVKTYISTIIFTTFFIGRRENVLKNSWKCHENVVKMSWISIALKKLSQLYITIGKYLYITPVINLKMYYFVARHCLEFILYSLRFLLICHLPQLMAYVLIKHLQNILNLKT